MRSEPAYFTKNIYARLNSIHNMLLTLEESLERDIVRYKKNFVERKYVVKPGTMLVAEAELLKAQAAIRELRRDANRMAAQGGEEVIDWWNKRQQTL